MDYLYILCGVLPKPLKQKKIICNNWTPNCELQSTVVIIVPLPLTTPVENIDLLYKAMQEYTTHVQGAAYEAQEYAEGIEAANGTRQALRNRTDE